MLSYVETMKVSQNTMEPIFEVAWSRRNKDNVYIRSPNSFLQKLTLIPQEGQFLPQAQP